MGGKLLCLPSEEEPAIKGKNLVSLGENYFL